MAYLIAKLGSVGDNATREIITRWGTTKQTVPANVAQSAPGSLVLVGERQGLDGRWSDIVLLPRREWPGDLPDPTRAGEYATRTKKEIRRNDISGHGSYLLDSRGVPCEVGHIAECGQCTYIVNFTGVRISDLPDGPLCAIFLAVEGKEFGILPPSILAAPPQNTATAPPTTRTRTKSVSAPSPIQTPPAPYQRTPPSPPPTPLPSVPFTERTAWRNVNFSDGQVTIVGFQGQAVSTPLANALYQPIRDVFEREIPEGVTIRGSARGAQRELHSVEGLERLASIFADYRYSTFLQKLVHDGDWFSAEDAAEKLPANKKSLGILALLGEPALGLTKRGLAFRRLIEARDRSVPVFILAGKAVLVPLPAKDNGPCFYAWEVVEKGHATYLFRPRDEDTRQQILDWTKQDTPQRRPLLHSRKLQIQLAFEGRVIHSSENGDNIEQWWQAIYKTTQQQSVK